jgi:hypothetical protein
MPDTNKREAQGPVRVVVEVDGKPVGYLELDMDRLWPLINHRKRDGATVEWMDPVRFDSILRAAVVKRLISRLGQRLYVTLGDEIVKAQLDLENFALKAENASQVFGSKHSDIEKLVEESARTPADFYSFFWDYLLDDREAVDLKKDWKNARIRPQ